MTLFGCHTISKSCVRSFTPNISHRIWTNRKLDLGEKWGQVPRSPIAPPLFRTEYMIIIWYMTNYRYINGYNTLLGKGVFTRNSPVHERMIGTRRLLARGTHNTTQSMPTYITRLGCNVILLRMELKAIRHVSGGAELKRLPIPEW